MKVVYHNLLPTYYITPLPHWYW